MLSLLLVGLTAQTSVGQYYIPSTEPGSFARSHYRLGQFDVIYPLGQDSLGIQVARYAQRFSTVSWLSRPNGIRYPLILRNYSSVPNGSVIWTPSRMELFTRTGGEEETPVPWLKHLVSHEIRHYAQMNALRQGTVHFASFLIGEQAVGIAAAIIPPWFLEGDAIYNESRLTGFGRANSGSTYQTYRADLLSGKRLKYDQYLNRSLRHFTPNHYSFGSMMVEAGTHDFGTELWPYVLRFTGKYPFTLFTTYWALKHKTGLSRRMLFDNAMRHADSLYQANFDPRIDPQPQPRGEWKEQRYPHVFDGGQQLAYLERGWHGGPRLMSQRLGTNKKLHRRTIYRLKGPNGRIRYADSMAVLAQFDPSPIWRNVVGSDVWVINLKSGRVDRMSYGLHAVSPVLNLRDSCIETIEASEDGHHLIRLSMETGEITDTARLPQNLEMRELLALPDRGQTVVRVASEQGTSLLRYDWQNGRTDTIYGPALTDISQLTRYGNSLVVSATYRYARRAFSIPLEGAKSDSLQLVLLPSYGVEEGDYSPEEGYYYADYKVDGYRISHSPALRMGEMVSTIGGSRLYPLHPGEDRILEPRLKRDSVGQAGRYYGITNALRIHSWLPIFSLQQPSLNEGWDGLLGLSILSQNDVGTLGLGAGYFWNNGYGGGISLQYKGIIPHLKISAIYHNTDLHAQTAKRRFFRHNYLSGSIKAYVPFTFPVSGGSWTLEPHATLSGDSQPFILKDKDTKPGGGKAPLHLSDGRLKLGVGFQLGWHTHTGLRDLAPRFGFNIGVTQLSTILPRSFFGDAYMLSGHLNLPGLWRSHALALSGSLYRQMRVKALQVRTFANSDYAYIRPSTAGRGVEAWSARAAYTLPWGYPDWNLGGLLYLKRAYSSFWFNWQEVLSADLRWQPIRTVGASLLFDVHLLRIHYPINIGVQGAFSPYGDQIAKERGKDWSIKLVTGLRLP